MIENFLISFAASVLAVVVVLCFERQRRPRIQLRVLPHTIIPPGDAIRPACTWVQVEVANPQCESWISWVYTREPALSCRAYISFYRPCGQPIFPREMPARWSGLVEPRLETITHGAQHVAYLRNAIPTVDIHANHSENIHPVVIFPQPVATFGWTNESYLFDWRHPDWSIADPLFIVRLRVTTADREFVACFRVDVTGGYADIRFERLDHEFDSLYVQVA